MEKAAEPMTKKVEVVEIQSTQSKAEIADLARKVYLAGLGAVILAEEAIAHFANRAAERGEMVQRESRKQLDKAMEVPQRTWKSAGTEVDHQIDALLKRLGVPTKAELEKMDLPTRADIEALSEKVAALSKKVDQLRKAEEVPAPASRKAAEEKKPEPVKA